MKKLKTIPLLLIGLIWFSPSSNAQTHYIQVPIDQPDELTVEIGKDLQVNETESIMLGQSLAITGGTPDYKYRWQPSDNLDDASIENPSSTPTQTTSYQLTVTDANNCTATDAVELTVIDVGGVNGVESQSRFNIFPNPSKGEFILEIEQQAKNGNCQLTITDLLGQIIISENFEVNRKVNRTISLTKFSKGVYLVKLETAASSTLKKIIIR